MAREIKFSKRIPEPKEMDDLEFDVFENLSSRNYRRWHLPILEIILRHTFSSNPRILDVACGPGMLVKFLASYPRKFMVTGIDYSDYALKLARKNCRSLNNVFFKKASVYRLPFNDETFDVVVCKDSLHHFNDADSAIKEMFRVLKKNGIIYIQDLRRDLPMYLMKKIIPPDSALKKLQFYSVRASYTKKEMIKVLERLKIKKYKIATRRLSAKTVEVYRTTFQVDPQQLKESFRSRYYIIIEKK